MANLAAPLGESGFRETGGRFLFACVFPNRPVECKKVTRATGMPTIAEEITAFRSMLEMMERDFERQRQEVAEFISGAKEKLVELDSRTGRHDKHAKPKYAERHSVEDRRRRHRAPGEKQ